jgi:acetyltransferase-like isoleucine patch superfamily enzyme
VSFESDLRELYARLGGELRERWSRDFPLDELIDDRWERARRLGFGEGASVYATSYVYGDVSVGPRTWIGPFTLLDGSGGLRIGENCSISAGVQIYTHDTVRWALSGGVHDPDRSPVTIGDCCFVGSGAIISRGVTIGDRCVVGAQSFVGEDVPPQTIVAGAPARRLGAVVVEDGDVQLVFD